MVPVSFGNVLKYGWVLEVLSILWLSSPKWISSKTLFKLWVSNSICRKKKKRIIISTGKKKRKNEGTQRKIKVRREVEELSQCQGTCPQGKSRNITCLFWKPNPVVSHFATLLLFPYCSCYSWWLSPSWESECKIHLNDYAVCSFLPYIFLFCLLFLLFVPHFRG